MHVLYNLKKVESPTRYESTSCRYVSCFIFMSDRAFVAGIDLGTSFVFKRGRFIIFSLLVIIVQALLPPRQINPCISKITAIYNWRGDRKFGLPLEIGETVQILEESNGWYRGFSTKNRAVKGIFPQAYIHLKPCKVDNEGLFESVMPVEDPVVREVTLVLREWSDIWKRLYVVSRFFLFVVC